MQTATPTAGGRPHRDDHRPGTFTFLYYPMPEWKDEWDGETVYFDDMGEIALAVKLRPNRAVFFDSRILHVGRAPSRACPALRVTVAYKLEAVQPALSETADPRNSPTTTKEPDPVLAVAEPPVSAPQLSIPADEVRSEGSIRVYRFTIPADLIDASVQERLSVLAKTVKLPGFRGGVIPDELMRQRYGAEARREALNRLSSEAIRRALPKGTVPGQIEVKAGGDDGDAVLDVTGTSLPALPDPDFANDPLERLTAPPGAALATVSLLRKDLHTQVLDRLDAAYRMPVLPALVDKEFALIWKAAEMTPNSMPEMKGDPKGKAALRDEFRQIAERRVRLGWVVAELARRFDIRAREGADLEERVIDRLISLAPVEEREARQDELRQLAEG